MAVVWIPPLLRDLTGGMATVRADGATVGAVIDALEARYPGCRERLCVGGALKPGIAAAVDQGVARLGLLEPVAPDSEVHFLPALAGGAASRLAGRTPAR